ncbi:MAG: hypothetical protein NXI04_03490 [Planctomycetaceae bacterium]|nr:hypothetical protein [Planctomycetaceae bacterium]
MRPQFVTKNMHAWLDYPVAFSLMVLPIPLGLGQSHPAAFWLSVVTGVAAFVLTLLTDHKLGALRLLPYSLHLAVDFAVAIVFFAAPLVMEFTQLWVFRQPPQNDTGPTPAPGCTQRSHDCCVDHYGPRQPVLCDSARGKKSQKREGFSRGITH